MRLIDADALLEAMRLIDADALLERLVQCAKNRKEKLDWYSWMPKDDWFCANGERRSDDRPNQQTGGV